LIKLTYNRKQMLDQPLTSEKKLIISAQVNRGYRFYPILPQFIPYMGVITYNDQKFRMWMLCFRKWSLIWIRRKSI
jgi:hypothetical protein